jgi:YHS domain-containing protein
MKSLRKYALALWLGLGVGAAGYAADKAPAQKEKPYPLTTCVVSGEKLDSMGKPVVIQYEGHEVRFCCAHCEPEFRKDPKKFMKKLDEAEKNPPKKESK